MDHLGKISYYQPLCLELVFCNINIYKYITIHISCDHTITVQNTDTDNFIVYKIMLKVVYINVC